MLKKYALYKVVSKIIEDTKPYSIRDLAKQASISVSTAKTCLDYLYNTNFLKKKVIGKTYQFTLKNNFLTKQLKVLFSLNEISSSNLVKELIKRYPSILTILIYGSIAKGEDTKKSDIDLLIISRKKLKLIPFKAEKKLNRELTIINYTQMEWKQKSKIDKAFYDNVIINSIVLYGEKPVVR